MDREAKTKCFYYLMNKQNFIFYVGPVVGSALYTVGGFSLPFYAVGGLTTLIAVVMLFIVPNINKDDEDHQKKALLKNGKNNNTSNERKPEKSLSLLAVAKVRENNCTHHVQVI